MQPYKVWLFSDLIQSLLMKRKKLYVIILKLIY